MSILHEYTPADGVLDLDALFAERKKQLRAIADVRKRAVITYAARLSPVPVPVPTNINFSDILPFQDLLSDLTGDNVDVILETPGGDGVVAREMVEILHERFKSVAFIIPGWAKSAGTIMAMGGHEILMGPTSALGPIDAQLTFEGKQFSADALLEGMKALQSEVMAAGRLNPAFIPMLQRISPGDLEHARNAMSFARETVSEWLCRYKFSDWTTHRTNAPGTPVTDGERKARADEIAAQLSNHSKWKTHARSLRLSDLSAMRLEVVDYGRVPELLQPIQRYYSLLRLFLDSTNAYKVIETVDAQFTSNYSALAGAIPSAPSLPPRVLAETICPQCAERHRVQLNFEPGQAPDPRATTFPASCEMPCKKCGKTLDLRPLKEHAEKQFGRAIIT